MAVNGYSIGLAVSAGVYTPTLRKSNVASGQLTLATGGAAITMPWVENSNSGTGDTTSKNPGTATLAALRALLDDRAANGDPTS